MAMVNTQGLKKLSMGVEWESVIMVVIDEAEPGDALPADYVEKTPFVSDPANETASWDISLEENAKIGQENIKCLYILEMQMGVFSTDTGEINLEELKATCDSFTDYWNQMAVDGYIERNGKQYPVVALADDHVPDNETFATCNGKTVVFGGEYTSMIEVIQEAKGKPQMTLGLNIEKVPELYAMFIVNGDGEIVNLWKYTQAIRKPNIEIYTDKFLGFSLLATSHLFALSDQYTDLVQLEELLVRTTDHETRKKINDKKKAEYTKSYISLKNRTNLLMITETFTSDEKLLLQDWGDFFLKGNSGMPINEYIISWINSLCGRDTALIHKAYTVNKKRPSLMRMKRKDRSSDMTSQKRQKEIKYTSAVPSLSLVRIPEYPTALKRLGGTDPIRQNYDVKGPFSVISPWANNKPPMVKLDEDRIKFTEIQEIKDFDIGEWVFEDNIVHLEIRDIELLSLMYTIEGMVADTVDIENLCLLIRNLTSTIVNSLMKDDPKYWTDKVDVK
jgi:hypothetical protein